MEAEVPTSGLLVYIEKKIKKSNIIYLTPETKEAEQDEEMEVFLTIQIEGAKLIKFKYRLQDVNLEEILNRLNILRGTKVRYTLCGTQDFLEDYNKLCLLSSRTFC